MSVWHGKPNFDPKERYGLTIQDDTGLIGIVSDAAEISSDKLTTVCISNHTNIQDTINTIGLTSITMKSDMELLNDMITSMRMQILKLEEKVQALENQSLLKPKVIGGKNNG
jgi:hypothetical protein